MCPLVASSCLCHSRRRCTKKPFRSWSTFFVVSSLLSFRDLLRLAERPLCTTTRTPTHGRRFLYYYELHYIGNCEFSTCPMSLRGSKSGSRAHDPLVKMIRLYQSATTPHNYIKQLYKASCQMGSLDLHVGLSVRALTLHCAQ